MHRTSFNQTKEQPGVQNPDQTSLTVHRKALSIVWGLVTAPTEAASVEEDGQFIDNESKKPTIGRRSFGPGSQSDQQVSGLVLPYHRLQMAPTQHADGTSN